VVQLVLLRPLSQHVMLIYLVISVPILFIVLAYISQHNYPGVISYRVRVWSRADETTWFSLVWSVPWVPCWLRDRNCV